MLSSIQGQHSILTSGELISMAETTVRRNLPIGTVSRERIMVRMVVAGMRNSEIAEDLNLTPNRVSVITNSPLFKLKVKEMQDKIDQDNFDVAAHMKAHLKAAATKVTDLITAEEAPPSVQLSAASKVLGYVNPSNGGNGTTNNYLNLTFEQKMEAFKQGVDVPFEDLTPESITPTKVREALDVPLVQSTSK